MEVDERDRKDYFTPSTGCFHDFCQGCIQRYGLQKHIIQQETVDEIDFDHFTKLHQHDKVFRVSTNHTQHYARSVVLAIGGGKPVIPAPFPSEPPEAASHAMWFEQGCMLSQEMQVKVRKRQHATALVVGGGLMSAQIADCLVGKGVSQVHLVMRGPWKGGQSAYYAPLSGTDSIRAVKPFDVDLSWMSKFRNQRRAAFWSADGLEGRSKVF